MKSKLKNVGKKLWTVLGILFGIVWGINVGIFAYNLTPERFRLLLVMAATVLYLRYEIKKRTIYVDRKVTTLTLTNDQAQALHEAVSAIYFADSSDYLTALWDVVRHLAPPMADLLETNEREAFEKAYQLAHGVKPE